MNSRGLSRFQYLFLVLFLCFNTSYTFAGPSRTTYQAKIVKPDGYPLEAPSVNFKFTILDPVGTCALYSETYSNVSMASSSGLISFSLGTGLKIFPVSGTTFEQVFSNITPFLACDSGGPANYSPGANDIRKIVMQFNDGSGWQTLPAMSINAVPYAMYANDSQTLAGKQASDFVQVATLPTCSASQALFYNGSSFSCVAAGGSGGSVTSSTITAALGYTPADDATLTSTNSSLSTVSAAAFAANSNVASVSSTVNSVSATVYAVSSTVSSLQNSVTSLSNSVAASFAAITSSQWSTSGTTISYTSGSVGIGTSNPLSTLHIEGSGRFSSQTGPSTLVFYNGDVTGIDSQITFRTSRTSLTSPTAIQSNDIVGSFFGAPYNGSSYAHNAQFSFMTDTASQGTGVLIKTGTSGVRVERFRITSTGNIGVGTSTPAARLDVSGGVRIGTDAASCTSVNAGTIRYNLGVVEYCNGTSWTAFGVSGSGIMSLNGLTSGSQTIAVGTAGVTPNVSSTGTTHTFNFPLAATGSVTAGLISNSDYLSFSNKADSASLTSLTSTVATSYSTLSSNIGAVATSFTTLNADLNAVSNTVGVHTASLTALAAAVSSVTNSQWVTSGTSISYNNGNVGIGTTDPNYKLAVSGSSYFKGPTVFGNTPPVGGNIDLGPLLGGVVSYTSPVIQQDTITDFSNPMTFGHGNIIKFDASANSTSTAMGHLQFTQNPSTNDKNYMSIIGDYVITQNEGSGAMGQVAANAALAIQNSSGTVSTLFGVYGRAYNFGGTVAQQIGGYFGSAQQMSAITTQNYGVLIDSAVGTVGTNYGLYISDQSFVTASQTYNIYSAGSNTINHFAGSVGIGVTLPTAKLHIGGGTNTSPPLKLTSGTLTSSPASGAIEYDGFNFYLTDGTNTRRTIATVTSGGTIANASNFSSTGNISMTPLGSVIVSSTTSSTNAQTGALVVKGGLGVAENLNVNGTISGAAQVKATGYRANQGAPNNSDNSTNGYSFGLDGDTGLFSPGSGGANGILSLYSNNTERLRVDGTGIGIGTASPMAALQVQKSSIASAAIMIGGGFAGGPRLQTYGLDADPLAWMGLGTDMAGGTYEHSVYYPVGVGNSGKLTFGTYNGTTYTERMRLTASGSLGVGTSTPLSKLTVTNNTSTPLSTSVNANSHLLHVLGSEGLSARILIDTYASGTVVGYPMLQLRSSQGTAASPAPTISGDSIGSVRFTGNAAVSGSYSGYFGAGIDAFSVGTWSTATGSQPTYMAFSTAGGGSGISERMRLDQYGNLGIANTSPTEKLDVTGNIKFSGRLIASTTGVSATMIYLRGTGAHNSAPRIVQVGNTTIANDNGRGLTFTVLNKADYSLVSTFNYDTYGSLIDSDNLAIALDALDRNKIGLLTSYDSWEGQVTTNLRSSFRRLGLMKAYYGGYRQPYTAIFEGASSGTVSTAKAVEVTYSNNSLAPYAEIAGWLVGGTYAVTQSTKENTLYNPVGDTAAVIVNNVGNVGISTSAPTNALTVSNTAAFNPSVNVSSAIMVGPSAGNAFGGGVLMKDYIYYAGMWTNNSGASLVFGAGGSASGFSSVNTLVVTSAATVGIGTAAPTEKLEVAGNLKVTGEIYGQKSWGFKKGPTSHSANYISVYNSGYHVGSSIDCTSSTTGCTILKAGTYEVRCVHRAANTASVYVGIALNGDRSALETRADAIWSHDHSVSPGGFTESNFMGTLSAGNFITCGAPDGTISPNLSYGAQGYVGSITIKRID